jgi:hypothetical protein
VLSPCPDTSIFYIIFYIFFSDGILDALLPASWLNPRCEIANPVANFIQCNLSFIQLHCFLKLTSFTQTLAQKSSHTSRRKAKRARRSVGEGRGIAGGGLLERRESEKESLWEKGIKRTKCKLWFRRRSKTSGGKQGASQRSYGYMQNIN